MPHPVILAAGGKRKAKSMGKKMTPKKYTHNGQSFGAKREKHILTWVDHPKFVLQMTRRKKKTNKKKWMWASANKSTRSIVSREWCVRTLASIIRGKAKWAHHIITHIILYEYIWDAATIKIPSEFRQLREKNSNLFCAKNGSYVHGIDKQCDLFRCLSRGKFLYLLRVGVLLSLGLISAMQVCCTRVWVILIKLTEFPSRQPKKKEQQEEDCVDVHFYWFGNATIAHCR